MQSLKLLMVKFIITTNWINIMLAAIISTLAFLVSLGTLLSGILYNRYSYNKDLYEKRKEVFFNLFSILKKWHVLTSDRNELRKMIDEIQIIYIESNFLFTKKTREFIAEFKKKTCYQLLHEDNDTRIQAQLWVHENATDIEVLINNFPDLNIADNFYAKYLGRWFQHCKEDIESIKIL